MLEDSSCGEGGGGIFKPASLLPVIWKQRWISYSALWAIPCEVHTPLVEDLRIQQGVYEFQMNKPSGQFHIKSLHLLNKSPF